MRTYQLSDYSEYLKFHSQLHLLSRNTLLQKFMRLPPETDIATLQAQIDSLRNVVCQR